MKNTPLKLECQHTKEIRTKLETVPDLEYSLFTD